MRISSIAVIVAVCALAVSAVLMQQRVASADGHGCPSSWPSQSLAGLHTDDQGKGWYIIRSSDSNGYTHVRAYVADDRYGPGYIPASPDELCVLIVRRPGDTADAAEPTQVTFRAEREPENLPFVEELFAALSPSEISCIRNIIGTNPSLQSQRLMDDRNTRPVYNCVDTGKWYDDPFIIFTVHLFALQDGGRSNQTINCLIEVSTEIPKLVHLRLGTVPLDRLTPAELQQLGPASAQMTNCMTLEEQIRNLLNIVVKQDALDRISDGNYIITEIRGSTNADLQNCISANVGSRLDEISGKSIIESFKHFPNGELLDCLLMDDQTSTNVYAHVASSRAGIASPRMRLSPHAEECFKDLATGSAHRQLVTLAVDPENVVQQFSTGSASLADLNNLVQAGFLCMTPLPTDPPDIQQIKFMDLITAFLSSNLALQPPL